VNLNRYTSRMGDSNRDSNWGIASADHAAAACLVALQVNRAMQALGAAGKAHNSSECVKQKQRHNDANRHDAEPFRRGQLGVAIPGIFGDRHAQAAIALGVVDRAIEISFCMASLGLLSTRGRQVYS